MIDLADLQGNILRGYRKPFVRHLVLRVADAASARSWLRDATCGDPSRAPQVTNAEPWDEKPAWCLNVGITFDGLTALELPPALLQTFPQEFREGMIARAVRLGDIGDSAPENWLPSFRYPHAVHLLVTIHADDAQTREAIAAQVSGYAAGRAFAVLSTHDGQAFDHGKVHFGYRDNIAQPNVEGFHDPADRIDQQPVTPLGSLLLGHPTPFENVRWQVPEPAVLGANGTFNAFRILEQRVDEFEGFLTRSAQTLLDHAEADALLPPGEEEKWGGGTTRHAAMREVVAAKILGRWRNGVPVEVSPTSAFPDPPLADGQLNDFDYDEDDEGMRCPMGSHIRRCNPRHARIVQRSTNHARRIVRRGIPYGPEHDPANPDGIERGLLGVFICASLAVQFESIQYDWLNVGLQDPRITGTNDAVVGANDPLFSCFKLPVGSGTVELRDFPRFVRTRGGAYCFVPTLSGLRHLGSLA
ncbi:MAG: Dyp-type peroxidase [Acidimicrobiales bacterium]